MAGVEEEDAVPPHLYTVRFYSDHTLTAMFQMSVSFPVCSDVSGQSVYGCKRSRRGFKCNKSITMLQCMIIDWKVKWPHAGKVTADTAVNHIVSRQRSGRGGMEK